jgi:TetR/AcrR family transcriptional regulator, mexJK operon transcriptional repressor
LNAYVHNVKRVGLNTGKKPRHRPVDLAKREAILVAARDEFFAAGFAAASIESIAEAAGVSKVTIYNRFGSKETLFSEMVGRECQMMGVGLLAFENNAGDLRQQLIDFGEKAVGFLTMPHIMRFEKHIAVESEQRPEIGELFLNAGPRRMQQKLTELLESAVANGAITQCDCALAAGHLYGMILGFDVFMARFSMDQPDDRDLRANVEIAVDRFLAAYAS